MAFTPGSLAKVVLALNKEIGKISFVTRKGMIKAGLRIMRGSQLRTPVDTGNLRASAFVIWGEGQQSSPSFSNKKGGAARAQADHLTGLSEAKAAVQDSLMKPGICVGHTAAYSLYVHENVGAKHVKGKPKATGRKVKVGKVEVDETVQGQAKFLEDSLRDNMNDIIKDIIDTGKESL